jgi:ubiquinone/menaquinone biosynthesis C-methylase UbiE
MNKLENWFCATNFWRRVTQQRLLPWILAGADLGSSVLELGAGLGAATPALLEKFSRVTSLEFSREFAARILRQSRGGDYSVPRNMPNVDVVQGDAARLPFADESFSCVIAILLLHHLRSVELQDAALREVHRVLQPGGLLLAMEIHDGWLQRLIHTRSIFVPFSASGANARLRTAGFADAQVDSKHGVFLFRARRAS